MPTSYSQMKPMQLRKCLQKIEAELEAACPILVAEIRLVKTHIEAKEKDASETYADAPGHLPAIYRCLDLNGDWKLTKAEIATQLIDGGYMRSQPDAAQYAINNTLNYYLGKPKGKAQLSYKGEKVGRPKTSM